MADGEVMSERKVACFFWVAEYMCC